jgi:two-component system cell cycle response regulator DivK
MGSRHSAIAHTDAPIHVLVADDDPDALNIYRQYLTFVGMDVETACDGCEAVQRAQMHLPDVIVMDISMPFLEGDDAAMLLKGDLRTRDIPIIAVSAFGGLARSKARDVAFDGFYGKPLLPEDLATIVRAAASPPSSPRSSRRRRHPSRHHSRL